MNEAQLPVDSPEAQAAIYRVALSLDAFLVNGILYGVLPRLASNGFLQMTASNLLSDLASLGEYASRAPEEKRSQVPHAIEALHAKCQQLVDLVMGLTAFRTMSLEQLRAAISRIPMLRQACVERVQELEDCLQTPQPFYSSRPADLTELVMDFLANLPVAFTEARQALTEYTG